MAPDRESTVAKRHDFRWLKQEAERPHLQHQTEAETEPKVERRYKVIKLTPRHPGDICHSARLYDIPKDWHQLETMYTDT